MRLTIRRAVQLAVLAVAVSGINSFARHGAKKSPAIAAASPGASSPVLWVDPTDIAARNLYYGPGGAQDQPRPDGTYTFLEEDLHGTNPKIDVKDQDGVKWTVKLGAEAKPEIAATRLMWSAGYFATEDYLLHDLKIQGLPAHLHRGGGMIAADGTMHDVRLKRHMPDEKKIANWEWKDNVFLGTREWNGLRALMALMNNWDLTDENNGILLEKSKDASGKKTAEQIYMVTDVGSTFGSGREGRPLRVGRGDLSAYRHSKFITRTTPDSVDFFVPPTPSWLYLMLPPEFISKLHIRWIGRDVPRQDAKWIGQQLGRLSMEQIRDAFRAAGFSPAEVEGFANAVENRIGALQDL